MMNQSDIFKKVGVILNELREQYEFLAQNPEQLNELELELFLANANFLSDHVEIVRKLNANKVIKELPQHTEISIKETEQIPAKPSVPEYIPVVDDMPEPKDYSFFDKPADLVDYVNEEPTGIAPTFEFILNDRPESDKFDYEEKTVDAIFDRPLSKEEEQIIAEKQKIREQQLQQPEAPQPFLYTAKAELLPDVPEEKEVSRAATYFPEEDKIEKKVVQQPSAEPVLPKEEPGTASSLFPEEPKPVTRESINEVPAATARPTLNDLLAGKNNSSVAAKDESAKPAISSLKGAITLNEKLLYIKDLFNGYNLAYSEAIELIDKMPDLKTADAFLKNSYSEKNNWPSKQATVDQFYKLLAQRFPGR
jgi:primosomal protein N''